MGGSWVGGSWAAVGGADPAVGSMAKRARRIALLEAAGGHAPEGTGTPCAECEAPRTILNTGVTWSDAAKTRLTFHYAVCDAYRSAKLCQRLRDNPAAKLVQMGADAAARTKRAAYAGEALAASACTERIVSPTSFDFDRRSFSLKSRSKSLHNRLEIRNWLKMG